MQVFAWASVVHALTELLAWASAEFLAWASVVVRGIGSPECGVPVDGDVAVLVGVVDGAM